MNRLYGTTAVGAAEFGKLRVRSRTLDRGRARWMRVVLGSCISGCVIGFLDVCLGIFFCRDGQFREWRLPPFPLLHTASQAEWLARDDWPYYRFDAELGWTLKAGAVFSEGKCRTNSAGLRSDREYSLEKPPGVLRVAAFGDSYVHGDDVDNTDTAWARMESANPRLEVMNFGVPGYGTDQGFLRYQRQAVEYHPDVVLIGLMPENVQRNVSVFRPAYYPQTGLPLAKPRFRLGDGGSLQLVPCPASSLSELRTLVETGRLTGTLGETDYWVARAPLAYRGSALFSSSLFRVAYAAHANGGRQYRDYYAQPASEPFAVTEAVLKAFAERALSDGAKRAIVVILPDKTSLREEVASPEPSRYWATMADRLQAAGVECLDLFPVFVAAARREGVDALFVGTHYNAAGHALLAKAVGETLARELAGH
jgi:lysophospholipase L1-like esterase